MEPDTSVTVMGKTMELSTNLATSLAKKAVKHIIKRAMDTGIGY
ncbi:hypothetical protein [Cerina litoralis]|nr:hypothetical protein [Cerina litoralis]